MSKDILFVGGSKGGVGKSIVSMALLDILERREKPALLIETDTSNPDVWHAYKDAVAAKVLDLDRREGWLELIDVCDANPDLTVVVNTAARNMEGVEAYGGTLASTLTELRRRLRALWVINRHRDSVELLKVFKTAAPDAVIAVVRNAYFGKPEQFAIFNDSNLRREIEGGGGRTIDFPDVADRVVAEFYSRRLTIAAAAKGASLGNRAEIARWRAEFDAALSPDLYG